MSNQAPDQPDEQRPGYERYLTPQSLLWALLGIILLLAIVLPPLLAQSNNRLLKPLRPTTTPGALVIEGEPLLVAFIDVNEDPFSYLNQRIRVTGEYTPLPPPDCTPFSGRRIRWALVAENLQMNAVGFEPVLRLLRPETTLTVEGIWRLYSGPAGCGKEAPRANVWYLEVERIIQPNPLTGFTEPVGPGPIFPVTPAGPLATPSEGTGIPTPTATPSASVTTTITPVLTPSPSATAGTPTPTVTIPGPVTATATATETGIATGQPTATFTPPAAPTPIPEPTTPPPVESATPGGGYPGPETPTPTPEGAYP